MQIFAFQSYVFTILSSLPCLVSICVNCYDIPSILPYARHLLMKSPGHAVSYLSHTDIEVSTYDSVYRDVADEIMLYDDLAVSDHTHLDY